MTQTLGAKSWYKYTSDAGTEYSVLMDDTLAAAAGFELDAAKPQKPSRFKMRVLHLESQAGDRKLRKRLACPSVGAAIYARNVGGTITIGTGTWAITGRSGETQTFASNKDAVAPVDPAPALPPGDD